MAILVSMLLESPILLNLGFNGKRLCLVQNMIQLILDKNWGNKMSNAVQNLSQCIEKSYGLHVHVAQFHFNSNRTKTTCI